MSVLNCLGTKPSQSPELRLAHLTTKLEEKKKLRGVAVEFFKENLSKLVIQTQELEKFRNNSALVAENYKALILSENAQENYLLDPGVDSNLVQGYEELTALQYEIHRTEREMENITVAQYQMIQDSSDLAKEIELSIKQVSDVDIQINKISLKIQMLNQI